MEKISISTINDTITIHNNIIESKCTLTLQERRLLLWLSSKVSPYDDDFKEHCLTIKEFSNLIETKSDNIYATIPTIIKKLMKKILTIESIDKKETATVAWLSGEKHNKDTGKIWLSFHPYLKQFYLHLKNNFTTLQLSEVMGLQSVYAIRIFELIKQKEYIGKRTINLNDLRDYCGISSEKYKQINDLKRKVLDVSTKEINKKTEMEISYIMVKEGRKFVAVSFEIKNKNDVIKKQVSQILSQPLLKSITYELSERDRLSKTIQEFGFSRSTVLKMIDGMYDLDIDQAVKSVENQMKNSTVRNPKAMLRTALKERWKSDAFDLSKLKKVS